MKRILPLALLLAGCLVAAAQTPAPKDSAPVDKPKLTSDLYDWEKLKVEPPAKGGRRRVFDAPTATVDLMHCHVTTLKPGEKSGEPSKHLQEEVIVVKE